MLLLQIYPEADTHQPWNRLHAPGIQYLEGKRLPASLTDRSVRTHPDFRSQTQDSVVVVLVVHPVVVLAAPLISQPCSASSARAAEAHPVVVLVAPPISQR